MSATTGRNEPGSRPGASGPLTEVLDRRLVVALMMETFGRSFASVGLVLTILPITVAALAPDHKDTVLGILVGLGAIVTAFTGVFFGVTSDRCSSRFGMRRPFIAVGAAFAVGSLLIMATASNLPMLFAGNILFSVATGVHSGGAAALIPDQIPASYRGRIMGFNTIALTLAGMAAAVLLPRFLDEEAFLFVVPAVIMAVSTVPLLLVLQDRILAPEQAQIGAGFRDVLAQARIHPRDVPDFMWAWAGKALVTLGSAFATTYSVYLLTDQLTVSENNLPGLITITGVVGLLTTLGGAAAGAYISDRFRIRKRLVLWTSMLIAVGIVICGLAPDVPIYLVGLVIMGIGTGIWLPVDGALMIDVLPGEGRESGKYSAFMQLADAVPRAAGPFLAPVILVVGAIGTGKYSLLYLLGAAVVVCGGVLVRKIEGSH
ncbi:MFS transporter [Nocardia carnea]|uniref:MFS transporter n=1 Tax=Nocardia carnea TaxID=37328 RepID=UPI00245861D9|nr:MFS transporter [Nocardia carnea]